jgi:hypothetical protein
MKLLFLFFDGIGLGGNNPELNPFARAEMPNLQAILGGNRLLMDQIPLSNPRATLLALDACLGVTGAPQSATGQATLLTGQNIPAAIGYHYGPKPNAAVGAFLQNGNIFSLLQNRGKRAAFLNAYPPRYFASIETGKRIYSAIPLAATSAGMALRNEQDLRSGTAISADFTAQGWRDFLKLPDTPLLTPYQAGERLAYLSENVDLAFFEYWLSDYAGHRQDMSEAVALLEMIDSVLGGLFDSWDDEGGLILLTSDHGNLEDLSTRRHTLNPVPALLVGSKDLRRKFAANLSSLADVTPAILNLIT